MLSIKCPVCNAKSFVEENMLGEKVACLTCRYEFICDQSLASIAKPRAEGCLAAFLGSILCSLIGAAIGFIHFKATYVPPSRGCCVIDLSGVGAVVEPFLGFIGGGILGLILGPVLNGLGKRDGQ